MKIVNVTNNSTIIEILVTRMNNIFVRVTLTAIASNKGTLSCTVCRYGSKEHIIDEITKARGYTSGQQVVVNYEFLQLVQFS